MKILACTVLVIVTSGCASTTPNVAPRITLLDLPEIDEIHTVEVGSSLVQKARVYEYDAYELLTTYEYVGTGINIGLRFTADPGIYAMTRKDSKWNYYIATGDLFESCGLGLCSRKKGGFMKSKTVDEIRIFENTGPPVKIKTIPNWRKTTFMSVDEPSFRQELVYSGRSGSIIRVLYREFLRDMIRPAFSQELTYDLSDGSLVGFRGVRIDVISTSNVGITYRVLNSFPDLETN